MSKLISPLFLTLFALFFSTFANGQVLKNTNLNLNVGGELYDVVFMAHNNKYIICGSFTSVNGQPRSRLAVLNSDFSLHTFSFPVFNEPGAVCSAVEVFGRQLYVACGFSDFGILRFDATFLGVSFVPRTDFNPVGSASVYDLEKVNDTIIAVGHFQDVTGIIDGTNVVQTILKYDKFGFRCGLGVTLPELLPDFFNEVISLNQIGYWPIVKHFKSGYYIAGSATPKVFSKNGNLRYSIGSSGTAHGTNYISIINDSMCFLGRPVNSNGAPFNHIFNLNTNNRGTTFPPIITPNPNPLCNNYNSFDYGFGMEIYNNEQLFLSLDEGYLFRNKISIFYSPSNVNNDNFTCTRLNCFPFSYSAPFSTVYADNHGRNLKIAKNFLFVSHEFLSNINGTPRTGLAVFCLEPENPKRFIQTESTVCQEEVTTYSIPASISAQGYKWSYSGNGAQFYSSGSDDWEAIPSTGISFPGASNTLNIRFAPNATNGVLSITPYTTCNTATDFLFAKARTINITVAPKPIVNFTAAVNILDTAFFRCNVSTLNFSPPIIPSNCAYQWTQGFDPTILGTSSTYQITNSNQGFSPTFYTVKATEPVNQCTTSDIIRVLGDYSRPQPQITSSVPIWYCSTDSSILTVTNTAANPRPGLYYQWDTINNFSSPIAIGNSFITPNPLVYLKYGYASNGCKDSTNFNITTQYTYAYAHVAQDATPTTPFEMTYNCNLDSLVLPLVPNTTNANASTSNWTLTANDSITIDTNDPTYLDSLLANNNSSNVPNVVYRYSTIDNVTGCVSYGSAVISFDFTKPIVVQESDSSLTCSTNNLVLTHTESILNDSLQGWLNDVTPLTPFELVISDTGNYVYQVIATNGCKAFDTVHITRTNELIVLGENDSTVCLGTKNPRLATAIGNGVFDYVWNDTYALNAALGGADSIFAVTVTNASGCLGRDTLIYHYADTVAASFISIAGCGSSLGSIQVGTVTGGNGNSNDFLYAFNNGSPSTVTNFAIAPGAYPIDIYDTLGCKYSKIAVLDANAQAAQMEFWMSGSVNLQDEVALVNTTNNGAIDSVYWTLPAGLTATNTSDTLLFITASDTGSYVVSLTGMVFDGTDTCLYTTTKTIYFGEINYYKDTIVNKGLVNYLVSPNPTGAGGTIQVQLVFGAPQTFSCYVIDASGAQIAGMNKTDSVTNPNLDISFPLTFPIDTASGTYRLNISSVFFSKSILILVN